MSLNLLKYIGLGILGLGGASSVAALSSSKVRKFIGISSVISQSTPSPIDSSKPSSTSDVSVSGLSEEDRQGQFLYRLSKEVFDALKKGSESDLSKHPKDDVIKGLKYKFNGSLANEDDKWENFKSLCDEQRKKETKSGKDVDNIYSRLCFLDNPGSVFDSKGYLWNGYDKEPEISRSKNIDFLDMAHSNFDLGTSFNKKYPNESPLNKFDEGYSLGDEIPKNFRDAMRDVATAGASKNE